MKKRFQHKELFPWYNIKYPHPFTSQSTKYPQVPPQVIEIRMGLFQGILASQTSDQAKMLYQANLQPG